MTKLIVAFRNSANARKKSFYITVNIIFCLHYKCSEGKNTLFAARMIVKTQCVSSM
jgi:hypothetical protein